MKFHAAIPIYINPPFPWAYHGKLNGQGANQLAEKLAEEARDLAVEAVHVAEHVVEDRRDEGTRLGLRGCAKEAGFLAVLMICMCIQIRCIRIDVYMYICTIM